MSKVLLVTSSPRGAASHSSKIARTLADQLASADPRSTLVSRDLFREPLPHIGEDFVSALGTAAEKRTPAQSAAVALSDRIIAEVFAADVIVIASAMINFGISSTLKTYIDHLLRAGSTFRYTEKGPEGLVKGKKAYIVQASGGVYSEGPMQSFNFQDTYLKRVLSFIGITDVEVISIEGVAFGPEATEKALQAAAGRVSSVRPPVAATV
ncbi:MAG TPA: FMN-dependent NADH-azoreductase [Steroidobacteraceae bacterium]|nr:FMN-dependent NADH-azoreductase [Steroidobacteraceae bacterium]